MNAQHRWTLVIISLAALSGACNNPRNAACFDNNACEGDSICVDGSCVAPIDSLSPTVSDDDCRGEADLANGCTCNALKTCTRGSFCDSGVCSSRNTVDQATDCDSSSDCPNFGQYCNATLRTCVECINAEQHCNDPSKPLCVAGTCTASSDCRSEPSVCDLENKRCDPGTGTCVQCVTNGPGECADGLTCRDKVCVSGGGEVGCTSSSDCLSSLGQVCDLSSQNCVACNTSDLSCPDGFSCNAGACEVLTGGSSSGGTSGGGSSSGGSSGGIGGGGGNGTCLNNNDCSGGLVCNPVDPTTLEVLVCGNCSPGFFDNCNTGSHCDGATSLCVTDECVSNAQCTGGEICYQNSCTTCLFDNECNSGFVCGNSGLCEPDPNACDSSADCQGQLGCVNGQCESCSSDSHCASDEVCNPLNDLCTAPLECQNNGECSGGLICQQGSCEQCQLDNECDTGDVCGPSGTCESLGTLGDACVDIDDCQAPLTCFGPADNAICTRPCSGNGIGADRCPAGLTCYQNFPLVAGFDGAGYRLCIAADQTNEASPMSGGAPFTQADGEACEPTNHACQSGFCSDVTNTCYSSCRADRDCPGNDVCYALPTIGDLSLCIGTDPDYTQVGGSCSSRTECDSGACAGGCSDTNAWCSDDSDCSAGASCDGACREQCRTSNDCDSNEICYPVGLSPDPNGGRTNFSNLCVPKIFNDTAFLGYGQTCTSDDECLGEWCIGEICSTLCGADSDCAAIPGLSARSCRTFAVDNPEDVNGDKWVVNACF